MTMTVAYVSHPFDNDGFWVIVDENEAWVGEYDTQDEAEQALEMMTA